jgi:homospermidine synthase
MTIHTRHASWNGPILMLGFGSIGRGVLPLILRHIDCDRSRITIFDPSDLNRKIAGAEEIKFVQQAITKVNYKSLLKPLLTAGPGPAFIVNLTVDVDSLDIMRLARETGALYIDTVIEPWPGFYYSAKTTNADRTNYRLREDMLALKRQLGRGTTAISCCGANPGMVSWFVKEALLTIARDLKLKHDTPKGRDDWGKLMKKAGVKGIHVAERDTQRIRTPKALDTSTPGRLKALCRKACSPPNWVGAPMKRSCRRKAAATSPAAVRRSIWSVPVPIRASSPGRRQWVRISDFW